MNERQNIVNQFKQEYMEENPKSPEISGTRDPDCGCDGNCCPPEKMSRWPKIVFAVVMLAAACIIAARLFFAAPQEPVADQQVVNDPNAPAWSDTSGSGACCDTTKSSSCCPK